MKCLSFTHTHTHTHTHTTTYFQFDVTNTLNDQLLEDVRVEVEESEGWSVITTVPILSLPYGNPATTYTLVEMEDGSIGTVQSWFQFVKGV